ncbi:MAG TPA: hypothetical protein PKM44_14075 [Turneriella sp.]|nr:hypothetical protein [Turneriella sp.]
MHSARFFFECRIGRAGERVVARFCAVQGFVAVTYSEDVRGRERFDFYLRLAGGVTF